MSILIVYEVAVFFAYLLFPHLMGWANLEMFSVLRWLGAVLGFIALALFVWVHRHLGSNFSSNLMIKDRHVLVTAGPYRWIRHPMYTAF